MDILAIGDQPVLSSRKGNDDLDIADSYHCMGAVLQLQGQRLSWQHHILLDRGQNALLCAGTLFLS